jgi:hypothetical protein
LVDTIARPAITEAITETAAGIGARVVIGIVVVIPFDAGAGGIVEAGVGAMVDEGTGVETVVVDPPEEL